MIQNLAIQINLLRKDFKLFVDQALAPYGLSEGTYFYLIYIDHHEGCSQKTLSEALHVDKAYTARVIKGFLEAKLITKEIDSQDGRSVCLRSTVYGHELVEKLKRLFDDYDEMMKQEIIDAEYENVVKILNKIVITRNILKERE